MVQLNIKAAEPIKLHCDNTKAISIAHNQVNHDKTKPVEINRHFIKEKLVCVCLLPTVQQITGILTKGLLR